MPDNQTVGEVIQAVQAVLSLFSSPFLPLLLILLSWCSNRRPTSCRSCSRRCCCCGGPTAGLRLVADGREAVAVAHDQGGVVVVGIAERLAGAIEDDIGLAVVGNSNRESTVVCCVRLSMDKKRDKCLKN
jgi:hypothetical protein